MTIATQTTPSGAARTNATPGSLVKVVVAHPAGRWVSPAPDQMFHIDEDARLPLIEFEIQTPSAGPFAWSWEICWSAKRRTREAGSRGAVIQTFRETGSFSSGDKRWRFDAGGMVIGGDLTVRVAAAGVELVRKVAIRARNPGQRRVMAFLSTIPDVKGFEWIIAQESAFKHFIDADGEPIVAFDGGYGITQLTNPAPTHEQAWSWKGNIAAGCRLYQEKQRDAKRFLGGAGRTYTEEQLKLETWSRWNGGAYHEWNAAVGQWQRRDEILCDRQTGNIGWNMERATNKGQTEAALRSRDKLEYRNPPPKDKRRWDYTGVCYADHVNKD